MNCTSFDADRLETYLVRPEISQMEERVTRRGYSKGNKCVSCGAPISDQAERCKSCATKNRKVPKAVKITDNYSQGKHCPDCGKPITNQSERCRTCSIEYKKKKVVTGWQKVLLGNTNPAGQDDPITLCEICDERERTPDSWYCQECIDAVNREYAQKSLMAKLQREEKGN